MSEADKIIAMAAQREIDRAVEVQVVHIRKMQARFASEMKARTDEIETTKRAIIAQRADVYRELSSAASQAIVADDVHDPRVPSIPRRVATFARAIASRFVDAPVSESDAAARIATCVSCGSYDPDGWCNACGCTKNGFTLLTVKAKIRFSTCPLDKWDRLSDTPHGN